MSTSVAGSGDGVVIKAVDTTGPAASEEIASMSVVVQTPPVLAWRWGGGLNFVLREPRCGTRRKPNGPQGPGGRKKR